MADRTLDTDAARQRLIGWANAAGDEAVILTVPALTSAIDALAVHLWDAIAEVERLRAERARAVKPAERPWQVAFRLHRAGFRVHSKYVQPGWVTCWYQHPHQGIGATIDVRGSEVGRGGAR